MNFGFGTLGIHRAVNASAAKPKQEIQALFSKAIN
jgi:hypothetical protein